MSPTRRLPLAPLLLAVAAVAGVPESTLSAPQQVSPAGTAPADCPEAVPVLLSRPYAEETGLGPGDPIRLSASPDSAGCRGRVAGVYELPADPYRLTRDRPRVLLHLPHLATLTDREGQVDRFSVALRPGVDPGPVARTLESLLPGTRALETREVTARTSTTFRVVERFHRAIGVITIAAGGVFLACIMVLKIQERRAEVSALRLIGVSRRTLLGWVLTEAALVSLIGGLLGIGLGRVASWVINAHYREVYDTSVAFSTLTPGTVGVGLALAVGLGLLAGGAAAARLLALDPLEEVGG